MTLGFQACHYILKKKKSILPLNVYFLTTSPHGDVEFSIIATREEENVCVIGVFNASPGSARFTELLSMCRDHHLYVSDLKHG